MADVIQSRQIIGNPNLPPLFEVVSNVPQTEEKKPFVVDSEEKAVWAGGKYHEALERLNEKNRLRDLYMNKIEKWWEEAIQEEVNALDFFRGHLRIYAEKALAGKKSRTLKLPTARLCFRKGQATVKLADETTALSFLKSTHPKAVLIRESVSKAEIKTLLEKGEVIPGAELCPSADSFDIKEA